VERHHLFLAILITDYHIHFCLKRTIVQSWERECTMLRHRNPANFIDFALPKGSIVQPIQCAYLAFLDVTYNQQIIYNYFFDFTKLAFPNRTQKMRETSFKCGSFRMANGICCKIRCIWLC